jgi:antitoxin YefM
MAITASEARKNLFSLIQRVNEDRAPVEITSKRGDAVLVSRADWDAIQETDYLLREPANARHLLESLEQARTGHIEEHPLLPA